MTGEGKRKIELPFVAVVLVFVAMLSVGAWQVVTVRNLAEQGREARQALCVFRADLERRATNGRQFLHDHPDGIPGIPASTLRSSIQNQEATLEALSRLECS